ncbi:ABC transporter permease [Rheinheimera sp. 1928-s]|uniref:ABC transporter permease n=1 Tax=Rheinheimera sp. 1928-s TaxID=3033803 RepID=UPI002616FEFA|nr:ABC transporter permease [Rheinheimera sp. 1928-s]MDF3127507.1 ABC transporter permease [Rheinheimera sp. 1928-s]
MLQSWFKTAKILLLRQQLYALTIILTIGLTLGALVATFNLNYQLFMAPLPYPDAERLQLVRGSQWQQDKQVSAEWLPAQGQLDIYRQDWPEVETKALHNISIDVAQNLPGNPSFNLGYVTPEFLPMFDAPLALGRHLSPNEGLDSQVPVTVLSYQVWQQHFAGDPAVLGKTLQFRGVSFTVVGVLAERFVEPVLAAPGWSTDLWLSYDFHDMGTPNWSFNSNQIHLLLKLKADASPAQLAHSFEQWAAPEFAAANQSNAFLKNSSVRWRLESVRSRILGDAAGLSLSLLAGSILLCAIAIANIANLVLGRAMAQQRSLTIRIALGARASHLFRQYLLEFAVLAIPALLLCLSVAEACYQSLQAGYAGPLPRLQELSSGALSVLFAIGLLIVLCLTLALWLTRQLNYRQLQQSLQQSGKGSAVQVSGRTRQLLLMSQTLFCLVTLIYCSQIFVQALAKLRQPSGLDLQTYQVALTQGSLLASSQIEERRQLFVQAAEAVKAQSNATLVGVGGYPPISFWQAGFTMSSVSQHADQSAPAPTYRYSGDAEYLAALGLSLQSGETFSPQQVKNQESVVLISQSLARRLAAELNQGTDSSANNNSSMLDKPLYLRGATTPSRIIGVVSDLTLPGQADSAAVYTPATPPAFPHLLVRLPDGQSLSRDLVNKALAQVHPQLKVFRFHSSAEIFGTHTQDAKVATVVTAALSILALALAGLGIFAVIRTQIQLRQYELAVRQSLGARPQHLLQLTLVDSLKPLLWAVLLLTVGYSLLQLSLNFGWVFGFAELLQIAPLNAALALLTVLLLTTLIVVGCVRPLLTKPVVHALRGTASN